jgi:beta-glucosidase
VGYRYYQSFKVPVAYEFGYGLSYTQFEYSNLRLGSETFDGELTVSVDITNAGSVAGREAVQIYVSAPGKEMEKPVQELAAFKKTRLLNPGETETLSFVIKSPDIASFDESASSWSVEAGRYVIRVGASSERIMETAEFSVAEKINAGSVSRSLIPQQEIQRLSVNR